jgi:hypothetical protein
MTEGLQATAEDFSVGCAEGQPLRPSGAPPLKGRQGGRQGKLT